MGLEKVPPAPQLPLTTGSWLLSGSQEIAGVDVPNEIRAAAKIAAFLASRTCKQGGGEVWWQIDGRLAG